MLSVVIYTFIRTLEIRTCTFDCSCRVVLRSAFPILRASSALPLLPDRLPRSLKPSTWSAINSKRSVFLPLCIIWKHRCLIANMFHWLVAPIIFIVTTGISTSAMAVVLFLTLLVPCLCQNGGNMIRNSPETIWQKILTEKKNSGCEFGNVCPNWLWLLS